MSSLTGILQNSFEGGDEARYSASFSLENTLTAPISGSNERIHVARREERGIELDPLARFENQVVSHWLPRVLAGDLEQGMGLYRTMRGQGAITFEVFSASRLATMYNGGKIHWCEPVLDQHKIESITFPMDPEYDLLAENVGGPVVFIGERFDQDRVTVVQGNHRTAAVLFRGQERNESLYVLRFRSPRDSQKLMKTSPDNTYPMPRMPEKYSTLFIDGVSDGRA